MAGNAAGAGCGQSSSDYANATRQPGPASEPVHGL